VAPWRKALFHRFVLQSRRTIAPQLLEIDRCLIFPLFVLALGGLGILACRWCCIAAGKQASQTDRHQ
jgi:hypothetical protein